MALLRYPGGKTRLVKQIWPYLAVLLGDNDYVEPMVGGGSVALQVAKTHPKKRIILNDLDEDVSCFWSVTSECSGRDKFEELCRHLEDSKKPTDDPDTRFSFWLKIKQSNPTEPAARAFRFLFLTKTCFGGQVDAGPIGGKDQKGWSGDDNARGKGRKVMCQYWVDNILAQLREANRLLRLRTEVFNIDALKIVQQTGKCTSYFDPPYFPGRTNKLYRCQMTINQHEELAEFLQGHQYPWLLSYDNSEKVRSLYSWAFTVPFGTKYSHAPGPNKEQKINNLPKIWKKDYELLVLKTKLDIPEPSVKSSKKPMKNHPQESPSPDTACPEIELQTVPAVYFLWGCTHENALVPASLAPTFEKASEQVKKLGLKSAVIQKFTVSTA